MNNGVLDKFLADDLKNESNNNKNKVMYAVNSANGPIIEINGKSYINFTSHNYLGLACHPQMIDAAVHAAHKYGVGAGSARSLNGTMDIHIELEKKLAEFNHTEAAVTFQSRYSCNIGVITSLMNENDAILSDSLNHDSITDGGRMCGAAIIKYQHSDIRDLRIKAKVARESGKYNKIMIITEGIFPSDGEIAMLPEIVEIAYDYNLITYVDDAHAIGVIGQNGSGSAAHHDVVGKIDIQIGSLSKAIGVVGGYVAGSLNLINWLKVKARPYLLSTAMTPAAVCACIEALEILNKDTMLIDKLWHNGRYFKRELKKAGFNVGNSKTPITPCIIGELEKAEAFERELFKNGVISRAVNFGKPSDGAAGVVNVPTASHNEEMIDEAVSIYKEVGKQLKII